MGKQTRRTFLGAAAAGTLTACRAWADEASPIPIIDTHQHLWDLGRFSLKWLKPGGPITRSFSMDDYLAATAGMGVEKTVYMEVNVAAEQRLAEARYVVDVCRRDDNPMVAAVIAGDPADEAFAGYIGQFRESPYIKGVRHGLRRPEQLGDEKVIRGVRLLGELGMRFDLLTGPAQLGDATGLVDACPDTPFVLDHCGNADPAAWLPADKQAVPPSHSAEVWRAGIDALAERPNVVCKISGVIARIVPQVPIVEQLAPIVNHCLDAFGPERVMFAGDWPVCTRGAPLATWITSLREIVASRPKGFQRNLFYDNALRFYGIDGPS